MKHNSGLLRRSLALLLCLGMFVAPLLEAQQSAPPYIVKREVEVVLVNVVVRDKSGALVRSLKADDFTVLEDNKPQTLSSFNFEEVDTAALPPLEPTEKALIAKPRTAQPAAPATPAAPVDLHDRRLVVLFFDLSSMQPEDIDRAVKASTTYVDHQMTAADLTAVVSLSSSLVVNQDFTSDRGLLEKTIARLSPTSGQGFDAGLTGDSEGTPDTSQSFTADDTEYNIFNTDRRLQAIQSLSEALSRIQQKKSVIYFSSGMSKTGVENEAQLRMAINRAVRANVSLYTMDMRGLQAIVPGGEAQSASLRGQSAYSGAAMTNAFKSNFDSQETIATLATDTGGKAFLDSNDFNTVFKRVQSDTSAYYMLSYHSTNPARDGRFRKITVKCRLSNVKLEYRSGYYAPRDFAHSNRDDREEQLVESLNSELPPTDLDVYLGAGYFRLSDNRFYVPVSLVVRGSQIPFTQAGDKDKATLDIIGLVKDELNRPVGNVRETVKLNLESSQVVRRKNVQYQTGFFLPSGKFHLKFVIRENQSGNMGAFETDLLIPDYKKAPLKMSAVVLGSQLAPNTKKKVENPLVHDGTELIPNVTHVFAADGHLYFYYEVYDPAREKKSEANTAADNKQASKPEGGKPGIRLLTNIQFLRGKTKVYETPLVEARQLNEPDRKAAVFQFDVPLSKLEPGLYTCQVNVVDDAAGTFLFPRMALLVRKPDAGNLATTGTGQ